jgi:NADH-quinone oxidoreductase subunit L
VLAGVFVTAFYSFRMYFLVFHGKERYDQNPDAHHDDHADAQAEPDPHHHHEEHAKPHESPWVVTVPLLLLAFPSVVAGFLTIEPMLFGDLMKDSILVNLEKHPAMELLKEEFHGPVQMAVHGLLSAPFWLALAGVALSWYMYLVNPALPARLKTIFQPLYTVLENKYYMDWFNENVIARAARMTGVGLWKGGDEAVIDGAIVNGSARGVVWLSGVVRWFQTGYIYHYAFGMLLGVILLMSYFVSWPMLVDWFKR